MRLDDGESIVDAADMTQHDSVWLYRSRLGIYLLAVGASLVYNRALSVEAIVFPTACVLLCHVLHDMRVYGMKNFSLVRPGARMAVEDRELCAFLAMLCAGRCIGWLLVRFGAGCPCDTAWGVS